MSIHINQVLDYLENQRVVQRAENMESLMEMLHYAYTQYNAVDNEEIRALFARLRRIWEPVSMKDADDMFSIICEVCMEHEVLAFSHGVCAGMLLMSEVNRLP